MVPSIVDSELTSPGQPLDSGTRTLMGERFGHDFSDVRVHTGRRAGEAATAVQANAFTVGRDIVFGSDRYSPNSKEGIRLLAHELTHTIQQTDQIRKDEDEQHSAAFDPHPIETWTDQELYDQYDFLVDYLKGKTSAIYEDSRRYLREISEELSQRALAAGRTFSDARVVAMRDFFIANATSANPQSCIATLNQGVRNVLGDQGQGVRGEIQTTMAALQTSGRIGESRVIEFLDPRGRRTTGARRPTTLSQSIWDTVIDMAGRDVGWSVFGLSLMDGYHSITLTLDNRNLENPLMYWSDQWSSRGGWQLFDKARLDNEITTLTQGWWDGQPAGGKHRTRVTLWRLSQ